MHLHQIQRKWHCSRLSSKLIVNQNLTTDRVEKRLPRVALVVKNSPSNPGDARDVGLIPESRRSPGVGNGSPLQYSVPGKFPCRGACRATVHGAAKSWTRLSFPGGSGGKERAYPAEDPGPIPESGRSPGEGNGYPLQCSCLENPMDRGALRATVHGVTKNRTRLSD